MHQTDAPRMFLVSDKFCPQMYRFYRCVRELPCLAPDDPKPHPVVVIEAEGSDSPHSDAECVEFAIDAVWRLTGVHD